MYMWRRSRTLFPALRMVRVQTVECCVMLQTNAMKLLDVACEELYSRQLA
jgi:hypothetical protein